VPEKFHNCISVPNFPGGLVVLLRWLLDIWTDGDGSGQLQYQALKQQCTAYTWMLILLWIKLGPWLDPSAPHCTIWLGPWLQVMD
jgi:hypothetical protein